MDDSCVILDDRPKEIQPVRDAVRDNGLRPEVYRRPRQVVRKIAEAALDGSLRGVLLDNHIDGYNDLGDLGYGDVETDNGTTAGYRIAVNVLIPKMESGELPARPIGIMSAADVSRVRDEYHASGDDRYSALFFFSKDEMETREGETGAFFEAVENAANFVAPQESLEDLNAAFLAVAEGFRLAYKLTDAEMTAIFALTADPSYSERSRRGSLSLDSSGWHGMALVLDSIHALLLNLYAGQPNAAALGAARLREHRITQDRKTGLQLLLTGQIEKALAVVDELSFAAAPQGMGNRGD